MSGRYGRGQRTLEIFSIALFALLSAYSLLRMAAATGTWFPVVAAVASLAGWMASDLLSGIAHWIFDSFGSVNTPIIGKALIRPFREHHVDPEKMTRHDFVETHGASCFASLPLLVGASAMTPESAAAVLVQSVLLFTALGALATNQCHKWAHMDDAATPRLVRWAQRRWIVLPREHHRLHHTSPFDTHFCMSSGWFNRAFNYVLRAWR